MPAASTGSITNWRARATGTTRSRITATTSAIPTISSTGRIRRRWPTRSTQHGILNHFCDLQGDDAFTETYYQFTGVRAEGPHFVSTGRYVDHFQKRSGPTGKPEWRIANRVCIIEGKFDVADSAMNALVPPAYTAEEPCQAARDRTDVSYHRPLVPRRPKQG